MSQPVELISPEKQANGRLMPPKHSRFQPGQSGNPGGQQKGVVYVTEAYKRFGRLPIAELETLDRRKQLSVVEAGVVNMLLRAANADDWQAAHAALKEITDRLEGKAEQRKTITQDSTTLQMKVETTVAELLEIARRINIPLDEDRARTLVEVIAGVREK
jgi:hypothetical protein